MIGLVILPLTLIFGSAAPAPSERPTTEQGAGLISVELVACVPTFCEEWTIESDGALVCFDVDERYPAGHWSTVIGPDQGDVQVITEY